jgi:hypothetical protein
LILLKVDSKARNRNPALTFAVLLALAVFCWGLRYKLSLYHTVKSDGTAQAAKLLSQRERAVAVLKISNYLSATQSGRHVPHELSSHLHGATLVPGSFQLSLRSQKLIDLPQDQPQQTWRITGKGARPPPLAG